MPTPPIPEPPAFGDDLVGNLRDVVTLSRRYCRDCADFHVISVAGRLVGKRAGAAAIDRDLIVGIMRDLLEPRRSADILVAGSSDSGLLSWAVRAASLAAPPDHATRFRFTVIDRCGTPLELCRRFGERHGLALSTRTIEVGEAPIDAHADVVLVHSLLRFLPRERHVAGLQSLGSVLNPGGRILFSQRLGLERDLAPLLNRARLRELVDSGAMILPEPLPDFMARLERQEAISSEPRSDYDDEGAFTEMFRAAGLRTVDRQVVVRPDKGRRRLVAVLAADQ
jgi:SAM-dependent methyltransferase